MTSKSPRLAGRALAFSVVCFAVGFLAVGFLAVAFLLVAGLVADTARLPWADASTHPNLIRAARKPPRLDSLVMAPWREFTRIRPDLAEAGKSLLYQYGVGLAFLGTSRPDGGPRVHPMCPLVTEGSLLAFIVPSPKRDDLIRDGRYALHSFPAEDNEDAFYVTGRAEVVTDDTRGRLQRRGGDAHPLYRHEGIRNFTE